jgi:hypothetical protein
VTFAPRMPPVPLRYNCKKIKAISVDEMLDKLIEMRQIVECDNCGAPRQEIGCECVFCKETVQ